MDTPPSPSDPPVGVAPPGHRLPPTARLGAVRLVVANLERSVAWYQHVLGLRVHARQDGRVQLAAHGAETPLVHLLERPGATPVPRGGRLGLFHFALLLPDRGSLGAFLRHVADLGEPIGASDHLVSEALYLSDPDGLGIEVYADRPRSTWQVRNGELAMATLPLNAEDLVRSAGDAAWEGMPTGTTMGHVHLSVGDLERAEAFYHRRLGFDRVVWSYPGASFLSVGGYHHHLGLNTWSRGGAPGEEDARLLDWEVRLPSEAAVDAAAAAMAEPRGAEAGHAVERIPGGVRCQDPWGTGVRIVLEEPVAND